jgi:hypothetical protein
LLESQTRLPVVNVSPLDRVDTSKLDLTEDQARLVSPVLATPIGLALPEPDKAVKKFNLLPPEVAGRMRMKRIQEKTIMTAAAVLILLVGFGGYKFYKVHQTENNVSALQADITALNAQVPKFDLVVAANDAYTAGVARRASVLNSAIDWPLVLGNLISITPASAKVQSFNGDTVAPTSSTASSAATSSTAASTQSAATSTTSAAIGTVQLSVTGPGPSLSISEAWIDAVAGSQLFANPVQGNTAVNTDSSISFPFTISVTPNASLDKNASIK